MALQKLRLGRYDYAGYTAFAMYSVCSLSFPLLIVAIGKSLNFPMDGGGMAAGGVLHMLRSISMVITLLICGWISAFFGKRITMGCSIIMIGLGIFCCAFSQFYWMLFPCLLLAGMGEGIAEGILTPFVQDLHPESPERYVNIAHSFWSVGIVLAVFSAGVLLTLGVSWRFILGVLGALTVISSLGFLWKENPASPYPESTSATDWASIWRATCRIVKLPRFWRCCLAMFFGAGAEFGLTFWAAAYIELTFKTSALVAGLGVGVIALGMFIGRTLFGYFARPGYLRWILLGAALATIPVSLALALLKPGIMPPGILMTLLFILLFAAGIGISPYWPTTQVYGVNNMPEEDSTLLYVYFSAMGTPGCGFFSWFMGVVGDRYGLNGALMVVPASLTVFIVVVLLECWVFARKK
ncbi:MAG: MFS transporter [Lentisphaerae bacterium]|nr:MFS transporter [Lentisphaerota bacterium]